LHDDEFSFRKGESELRNTRKNAWILAGTVATVVAFGAISAQGSQTDGATSVAAATASSANYAALVNRLSRGHLRLLNTFPGPDGLTGIVAEPAQGAGRKTLAWGLDGKLLIPGPVLNSAGQNLTQAAMQSHGLVPKPMPANLLAKGMLQAPGFLWGHKGPLVTAFLDPNCIFCHEFWEEAQPLVDAGKLRVKVVPVGFLKPTSLPKAATILMQKDPENAWAANEAGFHVRIEEGATKVSAHLNPKVVRQVEQSTELLARSGEVATPTVVACLSGKARPEVFHGLSGGLLNRLAKGKSLSADGQCGWCPEYVCRIWPPPSKIASEHSMAFVWAAGLPVHRSPIASGPLSMHASPEGFSESISH
jgi:thiol:disulfide interchange protein DsbG